MRLAVSEQGYASAVESLVSGNELAARAAGRLAGRLDGYAAMAGDDSTATDFATSYDEAAAATVSALESTVLAFAVLARMVEASLRNHAHADARSTLPGWALAVTGPPTVADRAVGVFLATPPPSLGAADDGPSGVAGLVLDQLQDVFWPNADTDRVRAAGDAWRSAAEEIGLLEAHCSSALAALEGERSPEIPVAAAVLRDARERCVDLASQLGALGSACYDYAEHVDTKRSELLDLLEDLAQELAVGALLAGGLSLVSGGAAAGAAGAAGAARLASAGSKARGILASLRALTGGTALGVRPVAVTAGEIGVSTGRISRARVLLMEGGGGMSSGAGRPISRLAASEGPRRGHTLSKHSGKSIEYLRERAARHPTAQHASSFSTHAEADRLVDAVLRRNAGEIGDWLRDGQLQRRIDDVLDEVTGISVSRSGDAADVRGLRVILVRDPAMPDGYWIKTAFPQP